MSKYAIHVRDNWQSRGGCRAYFKNVGDDRQSCLDLMPLGAEFLERIRAFDEPSALQAVHLSLHMSHMELVFVSDFVIRDGMLELQIPVELGTYFDLKWREP